MAQHIVTESETNLSELIDRVLSGEGIVIIRRGLPVAELRPVAAAGRAVTTDDLDWLMERRAGGRQASQDAGDFVSALRDDEGR